MGDEVGTLYQLIQVGYVNINIQLWLAWVHTGFEFEVGGKLKYGINAEDSGGLGACPHPPRHSEINSGALWI